MGGFETDDVMAMMFVPLIGQIDILNASVIVLLWRTGSLF